MRHVLRKLFFISGAIAFWSWPQLCSASWLETAELTHAGGTDLNGVGWSVATNGDVAVVGIPRQYPFLLGAGSASVFVRTGSFWTEAAQLVPSNGFVGDLFGIEVAVNGDTIAIGAPTDTLTEPRRGGTVYVFVRPAGGWSGTLNENARLEVPGAVGADFLGLSVAFAGDSIVASDQRQNALFVFSKPFSGWSGAINPAAELINSGPGTLGGFIGSVSASAGVVVAGAFDATVGGLAAAGAAYVFLEPAGGWSGTISSSAMLVPSDPTTDGSFGTGVAMEGATVVVGSLANSNTGKGYVFEQPGSGWSGTLTENAQLVASDAANDLRLGWSAAISGNTVILGAPFAGLGISPSTDPARAYVFNRPSSGWSGTISQTQEIKDPSGLANTHFGWSVAISGTTLVVGAIAEPVGAEFPGAAFVYELFPRFLTRIRFLVEGPIRVAPGVPVEFPVQVAAGRRAPSEPTGEVLITDFRGQECRARLSDTGQGSCALSFPRAGFYLVFARYEGDLEFAPSISLPIVVIVSQGAGGH